MSKSTLNRARLPLRCVLAAGVAFGAMPAVAVAQESQDQSA